MIKSAIHQRKIDFYFLFIIFVGGIYSYATLPKQEAPDINPPVTRITAVYPGASQTDMDKFVTSQIEGRLQNMEAYDYAFSYTYNSVTSVICFMKYGYESEEIWNILRREMDDLQEELPDEVLALDVNTNLSDTAGMIITLTGENYDYDTLNFYGKSIIDELKSVSGVTKFEIIGEVDQEVKITVDSKEMNRLGLSYGELNQLIKAQNLEIPSGTIESAGEDVTLIIKGSFDSLEAIENLVLDVSVDNYSVLKLKDIAEVELVEESASRVFLRNGEKAILLVGYFEKNNNVLAVGDDVRTQINLVKEKLPVGLNFEEVVFQPTEVDHAINGFIQNPWRP